MKFSFNIRDGLKAHHILSDEALRQVIEAKATIVEEVKGLRLPITMRGVMVGWGYLKEDGTFVAETDDSPEGRELWRFVVQGTANCISIGPNGASPIIRTEFEGESKDGNEEAEARGSGGAEGDRGRGGAPLWFARPGAGPKGSSAEAGGGGS